MPVVLSGEELTALTFAADSAHNEDDNRILHEIVQRARLATSREFMDEARRRATRSGKTTLEKASEFFVSERRKAEEWATRSGRGDMSESERKNG